MAGIVDLKSQVMCNVAAGLNLNTRKIFFKFDVCLKEKTSILFREKYKINGRFKSIPKLEDYLISIKYSDYGNTRIFVDQICFRVQNSKKYEINGFIFKSMPKLVVRFIRRYRMH